MAPLTTPATPVLLTHLASYVPRFVLQHVAATPGPEATPLVVRTPAAVLLADIAGFTALTERLAREGPAGVETLSELLNAYFGQLIDLVLDYGGDIIEFTGDGIIALWAANQAAGQAANQAALVQQAASCALAVQDHMAAHTLPDDSALATRLAIGTGAVTLAAVGGEQGRWEMLAGGDPLRQVSAAAAHARPGDIVLSPEAGRLLHPDDRHTPLADGMLRLDALAAPPAAVAQLPIALSLAAFPVLRGYIPRAVLERVTAGQTDWLAELRCVTILFVQITGLNYDAPNALEQMQTLMRTLQHELYRYHGTVNQLAVDDKGTVFVGALGLPPVTHEDDVFLGVQAALALHACLEPLGLAGAIGVATGWVFCGARGSTRRRDYAMIGDAMNLAARLMQTALHADPTPGQTVPVLCDIATYEATKDRIVYEVLPPVQLKGRAEPVTVVRPTGRVRPGVYEQPALVGRRAEVQLVQARLQRLKEQAVGGVVLIEGEMGMGKSRLVNEALQHARASLLISLVGTGDAIERAAPYHAWRPVLTQIFHLDALPRGTEDQRAHVLASLSFAPEMRELAPLLNAVLPLDIPETPLTAQMSGQVRAQNTHRLLLRILEFVASHLPVVLVLEEAHWLDSASWSLAQRVVQSIRSVLLLVTTRPLRAPLPLEYEALCRLPETQRVVLAGLPPADLIALVCQRLGVHTLPPPVTTLLLEKSQGNPFFSQELALTLRDDGVLRCIDGVCEIAPDAGDLSEAVFPTSLQSVITSRIDRLLPPAQLTVKIASVIGHMVTFRTLHDIHPIELDRPQLADHMLALEQQQIMFRDAPAPHLTYTFTHILIQEVVYNLLLYAQRRELHAAVARWYERVYADDLTPYCALLAHHWSKAGVVPRALDYLERAGEHALRNHASREAVGFFLRALSLAAPSEQRKPGPHTRVASPVPVLRRARWERQIGEAYLNLGQLAESRAHLEHAVALLQRPMPSSRHTSATITLQQAIRQTVHRLWRAPQRDANSESHAVLLETARAYEALLSIYFFANESLAATYASLRTLNLAERTGPSEELARAYANMCIAIGTSPIRGLADAYAEQARQTVRQLDDLSTQAYVRSILGLYLLGQGTWPRARADLEQALDSYAQLGDLRRWGSTWTLLAQEAYFHGDYLRANDMFTDLLHIAQRQDDILQQAWALGGRGETALRLGQLAQACMWLEQANTALAANAELPSQVSNYGLLAQAWLRRGDVPRAQAMVAAGMRLAAEMQLPTAYYLIEGYSGFAEVLLATWEDARAAPLAEQRAHARKANDACAALARFARIFPIGQPRALLYRGLAYWLRGKPRRALRAWQQGLEAATQLRMPFEQGILHAELARHTLGTLRRYHFTHARVLFTRLHARAELDRLERLRR